MTFHDRTVRRNEAIIPSVGSPPARGTVQQRRHLPATARALQQPPRTATRTVASAEGARILRVSPGGIDFVLAKLAATETPVQVRIGPPSASLFRDGWIRPAHRRGPTARVDGPAHDLDLTVTGPGWIRHQPTVHAAATHLDLLDQNHVRMAALRAHRDHGMVWRALLEWLLLMETEQRANPAGGMVPHAVNQRR